MTSEQARVEAVDELLAKDAIRDALYRYCRGEDRLDGGLTESAWHADGTATYGFNGELFDGPIANYVQQMHPRLAQFMGSSHQVSNILIEIDGDRAVSEAYVTARLWRLTDAGRIWRRTSVGRYLDRWSCRGGVWAIDHRRFIFELSYADTPLGDTPVDAPWEGNPDWFEGRHGPSDPSYNLFSGRGHGTGD